MHLLDTLADRIKIERQKKGMRQNQLAEVTGLNASTISAYENKTRNPRLTPSIDSIVKISEALNVSIDYLCGLSEQEKPQDIVREYLAAIVNTCEIFQDPIETPVVQMNVKNGSLKSVFIQFPDDCLMDKFLQGWYQVWELYSKKLLDEEAYRLVVQQLVDRYTPKIQNYYDEIKDYRAGIQSQMTDNAPESDQEE